MPRFYFNVLDGIDLPDDEGYELPDLKAARIEATKVAGEMLRDGPPEKFWNGEAWQLTVTDGPTAKARVLVLLKVTAAVALEDA
jgi:hypothetical protein